MGRMERRSIEGRIERRSLEGRMERRSVEGMMERRRLEGRMDGEEELNGRMERPERMEIGGRERKC